MQYEIGVGTTEDLAALEPLWLQMLSHHRRLVADAFPVRSDRPSWNHALRNYRDWLAKDAGILLIARRRASFDPLGYAICRLLPSGATFDLGALRGDVDSLVVRDDARGQGIGSALLAALRARLCELGIAYWSIGVLAHNPDAARLYERLGFRLWTQELLATTADPSGAATPESSDR